jgi:transaldolase
MRPDDLHTRIFLDGGNQAETKEVIAQLGFLDGQTTNPTLVSKHPDIAAKVAKHGLEPKELLDFYHDVVRDVSALIPDGSVSIEVYADPTTTTKEMLTQAEEMNTWIPNAHIKFPTTTAGLAAAERSVAERMRVNMTLCFSQQQAAAVYAATRGAEPGQVFVSPFVGRLDDRGENGMQLITNIQKMYATGDGHVWVLTASVRSLDHFLYALALRSDIITAPAPILLEWAKSGRQVPDRYDYAPDFAPITYEELDLSADWRSFDIHHDLTAAGIDRFASDWNNLLTKD